MARIVESKKNPTPKPQKKFMKFLANHSFLETICYNYDRMSEKERNEQLSGAIGMHKA